MAGGQSHLDTANAGFWDELCGTALAGTLGVTDASPESLARFDEAYLAGYPYLLGYLPQPPRQGERLLEVGLGYGTISQILAGRGFDYHGLDIAASPVAMVRDRIGRLGVDDVAERVRRGSILDAPYEDAVFDHVIAIGCLHHTGDMRRAVREVHRILKPGGRATVMVYNRHSWRRFKQWAAGLRGESLDDDQVRASYDSDSEGAIAPATEYATRWEAKREIFGAFSRVRTSLENFDLMVWKRGPRKYEPISRRLLLRGPARVAGLDLYVRATK